LVCRQLFQIEVLVDEDAVHRDPDRVTRERDVGVLAGHGLDGPRIAADDRDLPLGEPFAHRRSRSRTALVELGVVLLPQLRVAGAEEHRVALAGLADPLPRERRAHVVHRDHVADRQPLAALRRQDVQQDAAGEERLEVLDAELLQAVGAADLFLRQAVVIADLAVARDHSDVAQAVELRSDLPDLAKEQLIVIVEPVLAERPARRRAREHDVGAEALAEERDALFQHEAELVDLARLDELRRLERLRRRHPVVRAALVLRPPRRRPPLIAQRVRGLRFGAGHAAHDVSGRHARGAPRDESGLDEVAPGHVGVGSRLVVSLTGLLAVDAVLRLEVLPEPTRLHRAPPRPGVPCSRALPTERHAHPFRMYAGISDVRKSSRGGAKTSITSVSSWNHASCSTPPGITPRSPGPHMRFSLPRRNSIRPDSITNICSCGCRWDAACAPAFIDHQTIISWSPTRTRREILSVTFSSWRCLSV